MTCLFCHHWHQFWRSFGYLPEPPEHDCLLKRQATLLEPKMTAQEDEDA